MQQYLVDDWKQSWRLWSVRFAVFVAAVPEVLYRLALVAEHILPTLSYVVLDNLPQWLRTACAVLALVAVVLRLVKQPPKKPPRRGHRHGYSGGYDHETGPRPYFDEDYLP